MPKDYLVLMIAGSDGPIETLYHSCPDNPTAPVIMLMPPHPEQPDGMRHPVMNTLFHVFARLGFHVMRFNYRGTGRSGGVFTNGEGEVSDAATCLDWVQNLQPSPSQFWVAGFSFGAYIALQLLMRRPECHNFIAVSPLANMYDFSFLAPCPSPGLMVHGGLDTITPKESVVRLAHQLSMQKRGHKITLNIIPEADHDYAHHRHALEASIWSYVSAKLAIDRPFDQGWGSADKRADYGTEKALA